MQREEIEKKDQELIEKFRSIVENKKKEQHPKRLPSGMILLFAGIAITVAVLFLKFQHTDQNLKQTAPLLNEPPVQISQEKPISPVSTVNTEPSIDTSEVQPVKSESTDVQPVENKLTEVHPVENAQSEVQPVEKTVMKGEPVPQSNADSDLNIPIPETKPPEIQKNPEIQKEPPPKIHIEKLISCTSVANKQYKNPKTVFSVTQDGNVKIWMTVLSDQPPFTLTHVYFADNKKYIEVPLDIRFPRMRTWSSIKLNSSDNIGKWRVEVVNNNNKEVLEQIEFEVVN